MQRNYRYILAVAFCATFLFTLGARAQVDEAVEEQKQAEATEEAKCPVQTSAQTATMDIINVLNRAIEDDVISKTFRPDITLVGGRSGGNVSSLVGPADSYVKGGGERVFETDAQGQVIRDITPDRVKTLVEHQSPKGTYKQMEKIRGPVCGKDLDILKGMGVVK